MKKQFFVIMLLVTLTFGFPFINAHADDEDIPKPTDLPTNQK